MTLKGRILWYPVATLLVLVTLCVALLGSLAATESGSRWVLRQLLQQVPGELAIERIEGTLLSGLALTEIHYALDRDRLQAGRIEVRWQPAGLFSARLQVVDLRIRDAHYHTPAGTDETPFTLPDRMPLPLAVTLEAGRIDGLLVVIGDRRLHFDEIELAARAGPIAGLRLGRLHIRAQDHVLDVSGKAALQRPYPYHAEVHWSSVLPDGVPARGQGRLDGDVRLLSLTHRLTTPVLLETHGTLRLADGTPLLALAGSWQALQWPLSGAPDYTSRQGSYELQGTPDAYHFRLAGDLAGSGLPALAVQSSGRGNLQRLEPESLAIMALGGRLDASGTLAWLPEPALELQVRARDLNPGVQWPEWPGQLAIDTRLQGRIAGEQVRIALDDIDLRGRLRDYPLQARGGLQLVDERFSANTLEIRSGANRISLAGTLEEPTGLEFAIAAPELAALWPGLEGRLDASGRVQGTLEQPAGRVRLTARGLDFRDYAADSVTATVQLDTQRVDASRVDLQATGVRIASAPLAELSLQARGGMARHRLALALKTEAGTAQLDLRGALRGETWEGELAQATFDLDALGEWRLRRAVPVRAGMTALEPLSGCWISGSSETCVQGGWNLHTGWRTEAHLDAFPLQPLQAFWDAPVALQGLLDADLVASGTAQGMEARLEARAGRGDITLSAPNQPQYRNRYRDARLTAGYADESARMEFAVGFEEGTLQGGFALAGLDAAVPAIDGTMEADIPDIRFIDALLPDIEVTGGGVRLQARVGGRLDAPRISGTATLEQGTANLPGLGLALQDIRLRAEGRDARVELHGSMHSGAGELRVSGNLDLNPAASWPFDLTLQGQDLRVVQLPDIEINASPDLALRGNLEGIEISGRARIPWARIRVRELPATVVKVSVDQVIVGEPQEPAGQRPSSIPVKVNVVVILGEDVRFEGLGLTTRLGGKVDIRSLRSATLVGNGILVLEQGRYDGYGQRLAIDQGRLLFAGPLDNPALDIRATRTVGQVVAGIELTGTFEKPETRLFSIPAMPDAEILSYIVTGKPLSSASGGTDSQALAAAASSLGANSPVAQEISRTLGVDIGTKSGATDEETAVTVGKQITPQLYVDYLYGLFTEVATLQFVYQLSEHFSLTGESGAEQAIDLRFSIDRD
jgi:translocation and assembly module TamB